VFVEANSVLEFRAPLSGCRAYLAVQGGFDLRPVLGSVATDARSGLGGLNGHWLTKHDRIAFSRPLQHAGLEAQWHTHYANPAFTRPGPLRLVPGSLWQQPGGVDTRGFLERQWHIAPDSDRMGIRLAETLTLELPGTQTSSVTGGSVLSSAVAFGSIQLPPDQRPIILAADRQTTGGYPLLGTLATVSHSPLAQLKPGDEVRFELIEVTEAQADWCRRELPFRRWQAHIRNWWQSAYVVQISS
jgi:antagonist of KipI